MTMQHDTHPDDERLAAFAGADPEAVSDRALADHIAGCDRCSPIVDEISILRGSLANLPDIAPSRPLRLIPPVPAQPRRSGSLEWLRRLAAPAMIAGAGLVLVGAVGVSGIAGGLTSKTVDLSERSSNGAGAPADHGGAPSPVPAASYGGAYSGGTEVPRSQTGGETPTPVPAPSTSKDLPGADRGSTEQPWLTLLIAGFGLFGIAAILRFSLAPRAG